MGLFLPLPFVQVFVFRSKTPFDKHHILWYLSFFRYHRRARYHPFLVQSFHYLDVALCLFPSLFLSHTAAGMASSTVHTARPVCVLFGPQSCAIAESLSFIHNTLQTTPSVEFFKPVLEELPSLWPVITDVWPALTQVPGATQLSVLGRLAQGESVSSQELSLNVLLTPITVLRQILEYLLAKERGEEHRVVDAQGFCVGFLSAAAVSCSPDTNHFPQIASAMVRLAVCIGAAVDLDALQYGPTQSLAVRWKDDLENEKLKDILLESDTVRTKLTEFPVNYLSSRN